MRDSHHSMGLMHHAALSQQLAIRKVFDEAFREYDLQKEEIDLPTAPASDLSTASTIAEAGASEHAEIWRGSRARELSGLLQAQTYGPASPIGNVIDPKWLFSWKSDGRDWISKTKSILVARGFKQREGIYFGESFAPTASSFWVRLLSVIACELDLNVCHFDAEQAFVQSKLDEDVFLRFPK